jgi:hypothetical protein
MTMTTKENYDETGKCPNCDAELECIEDCVGVRITRQFDKETKEWKETDTNYYGDTTTTYRCTDCDWKDEDFTDGEYDGLL